GSRLASSTLARPCPAIESGTFWNMSCRRQVSLSTGGSAIPDCCWSPWEIWWPPPKRWSNEVFRDRWVTGPEWADADQRGERKDQGFHRPPIPTGTGTGFHGHRWSPGERRPRF